MVPHGGEEARRVTRDRGGVAPDAVEQQLQPRRQQHVVLGDHHPHGSSTAIVVGPPAGLSTSTVPSSASARRRIPARPVPRRSSAPPTPFSMIATDNRSAVRLTVTPAAVARLCLATFVSASATAK